jgi:hypothetical protein
MRLRSQFDSLWDEVLDLEARLRLTRRLGVVFVLLAFLAGVLVGRL